MLVIPTSVSADRMASARDVVRPVTTRTRLAPSAASAAGTSLTRPAPNRTSAGTARSKRTTRLPVRVFRGGVDVPSRLARSSHHRRHNVPPTLIVTGFLMRVSGGFVLIDLDQHHVRRIDAIAQHIESHNP